MRRTTVFGRQRLAGRRRGRAGAAMLEYVLVCGLLVLVGAAAAPVAIRIIGSAFETLFAMVASPHPGLF